MSTDGMLLAFLLILLGGGLVTKTLASFTLAELITATVGSTVLVGLGLVFAWDRFSKKGRDRRERLKIINELPTSLLIESDKNICMGFDRELETKIYLPDSVRSKHVHILGATGSGKSTQIGQFLL